MQTYTIDTPNGYVEVAATSEDEARNQVRRSAFHEFEGDLYRDNQVVRKDFKKHFRNIETTAQFKATLRAGSVTWPGCYPLFFLLSDGETLSFDSARKNLRAILSSIHHKCNDGWRVVACDVNYEDAEMLCAHSGEPIPAAYA